MVEFPKDITVRTIKRIAAAAGVQMLKLRTLQGGVLATGFMKILEPARGVVVSAGSFKGQKQYNAKIVAETGLTIELRLHGSSRSQELDPPNRTTVVRPGSMLISGKSDQSLWDVHADAQDIFETVSIRYEKQFLTALADNSPDISAWALDYVVRNGHGVVEQTIELTGVAQQLLSSVRKKGPNTNLLLHALALQALALAWQYFEALDGDHKPALQHDDVIAFAIDEIEKNPHASLTVKDMAAACRMSESSMKSRFKQATGRSMGAFILDTRMRMAAEMLHKGVSVGATSEALGYSSAEAFSKAVKNYFGRSPRNLKRL